MKGAWVGWIETPVFVVAIVLHGLMHRKLTRRAEVSILVAYPQNQSVSPTEQNQDDVGRCQMFLEETHRIDRCFVPHSRDAVAPDCIVPKPNKILVDPTRKKLKKKTDPETTPSVSNPLRGSGGFLRQGRNCYRQGAGRISDAKAVGLPKLRQVIAFFVRGDVLNNYAVLLVSYILQGSCNLIIRILFMQHTCNKMEASWPLL